MKLEAMTGQITQLKEPLVEISKNERLKRAMKTSALFFGLTLLVLPIPGVHFVLVPLFLILTFVNGYKSYHQIYFQEMSQDICPNCSTNLNLKAFYFSKKDIEEGGYQLLSCGQCNTQIKLHKSL